VACITPAASSWPPLYEAAAAAAAAAAGAAAPATTPLTPGDGGGSSSSSSWDPAALAALAEQLAAAGLQLLLRATANAAVQEALTDEPLLRQLYWLTYQPPSARVLCGALALLRRLCGSPLAASVGGYQGGAVLLLGVLLHSGRCVCVEQRRVCAPLPPLPLPSRAPLTDM
jgi:hypothetical protein